MGIVNIFSDFASLFFPKLCAACNHSLVRNEHFLCTTCRMKLPFTNYHLTPDNEVAKAFWGRVQVENATALLHFHKKGIAQALLHKLKYKGRKEIGIELGKLAGYQLRDSLFFKEIDIIVPVPLHKARKRKRGYNQSECLAIGISEIIGKPVDSSSLIRVLNNSTQTRKHRYERWENAQGLFELRSPKNFEGKHILLVDDVITTGATLEACVQSVIEASNAKVSVFALVRA
jgi:ComF family protein